MDKDCSLVVSYYYDAWGNIYPQYHSYVLTFAGETLTAEDVSNLNGLFYKGYYYDKETGFYYLTTRYYDPKTGRFISPDDPQYLDFEVAYGYNRYAYCCNNPVMFEDPKGNWVETVFDLFSLGVSIVELVINPYDPLNWAGLAGDALDLIPFVTGVGETVKGIKIIAKGVDMADDAYDTIRIMKVVDLTDDAWDTVKGLDRAGDFTKSTMPAGRKIHTGYKTFDPLGKELVKQKGIRLDYFDKSGIVYELKPYNVRSLKAGVCQLARYRRTMGKGYAWILELY